LPWGDRPNASVFSIFWTKNILKKLVISYSSLLHTVHTNNVFYAEEVEYDDQTHPGYFIKRLPGTPPGTQQFIVPDDEERQQSFSESEDDEGYRASQEQGDRGDDDEGEHASQAHSDDDAQAYGDDDEGERASHDEGERASQAHSDHDGDGDDGDDEGDDEGERASQVHIDDDDDDDDNDDDDDDDGDDDSGDNDEGERSSQAHSDDDAVARASQEALAGDQSEHDTEQQSEEDNASQCEADGVSVGTTVTSKSTLICDPCPLADRGRQGLKRKRALSSSSGHSAQRRRVEGSDCGDRRTQQLTQARSAVVTPVEADMAVSVAPDAPKGRKIGHAEAGTPPSTFPNAATRDSSPDFTFDGYDDTTLVEMASYTDNLPASLFKGVVPAGVAEMRWTSSPQAGPSSSTPLAAPTSRALRPRHHK
jgi:hypothetical protein